MVSEGAHLLLIKGPSSIKGAPAGDRVLIGAPNISRELSFLKEASYVYQESSLRRLHICGQNVLARSPIEPHGCIHRRSWDFSRRVH